MSTDLIPVADIERMAGAMVKSNLFGFKSMEQAFALMLIAQAEGLHPAIAARDYHIIGGRPTLKADAMLARFQAAGGKVEWKTYTDECVLGFFSHPQGGRIDVEWTIQRARMAGLSDKEIWKKYPRSMLRSRVISEGIRAVYPGCVGSMHTPEEIEDADLEPMPPPSQPPASAEIVGLSASTVADFKAKIDESSTMEDLKKNFGEAYVSASRINDKASMKAFQATYESMKAKFSAAAAAPSEATDAEPT